MSLAELLLIFFVAILAIGPKQLPMVAKHLGKAVRLFTHFKDQASQFWLEKVKEWQLIDSEEKAAEADKLYQSSDNRSTKE